MVGLYNPVTDTFVQDFYELLGQPAVAEDWDALEFTARDRSESLLFVFAGSNTYGLWGPCRTGTMLSAVLRNAAPVRR